MPETRGIREDVLGIRKNTQRTTKEKKHTPIAKKKKKHPRQRPTFTIEGKKGFVPMATLDQGGIVEDLGRGRPIAGPIVTSVEHKRQSSVRSNREGSSLTSVAADTIEGGTSLRK